MQEQWSRWEPLENLDQKYEVESILDTNTENGLLITLYSCKNKEQKIEIVFKNYADSYRYTNESFSLRIPSQLSKLYGKEFYGDWTFFKITHSFYLNWLAYESCDYSKEFNFVHFCLLCPNSLIDIIARYEPIVRYSSPNKE